MGVGVCVGEWVCVCVHVEVGMGALAVGGGGVHACVRMGVCVWHPLQSVKPFPLTHSLFRISLGRWGGAGGRRRCTQQPEVN